MKRLLLLLFFVPFFGCKKDDTPGLRGQWTLIETFSGGTTSPSNSFSPNSEISIRFAGDGKLILSGSNPGTARSPLWDYDRYEIVDDQTVKFISTALNQEMNTIFYFENGSVWFWYPWARCGYGEKFASVSLIK